MNKKGRERNEWEQHLKEQKILVDYLYDMYNELKELVERESFIKMQEKELMKKVQGKER